MSLGPQDVAAGVLVLAALAWLVRRRLRRRAQPTPFCDSCPACDAPRPGDGAATQRRRLIPPSELTRPE